MIKKLFICVVMLFVLSACSSPEAKIEEKIAEDGIGGIKPPNGCKVIETIDEFERVTGDQSYNRETDADRNFDKLLMGVTDTGETLYAVSDFDWIIYFDKKTGNSGLLCGKPECDHMNNECNSYMKNCWGLQYYNGYLYTIQSGEDDVFKLKKISTDGSEREDLGKLVDADVIIDGGRSINWIIHRGYIYYVYELASHTEDTFYLNKSNCIYRRSLEKDSKPECIMPLPLQSWWAECQLIGTGSYVYMLIPTADKETDCYLYRYNTETGKLEWFKEWGNNISGVAVNDNKIYYLEKDMDKTKIYCFNPKTSEKSVFVELIGVDANITYDDDFIYISKKINNEALKREIWSWEGIYLADIEENPADDGMFRRLSGSDDKKIYISSMTGSPEENIYNVPIMGFALVIEYIEKEDIRDGEYEIKEWREMAE